MVPLDRVVGSSAEMDPAIGQDPGRRDLRHRAPPVTGPPMGNARSPGRVPEPVEPLAEPSSRYLDDAKGPSGDLASAPPASLSCTICTIWSR